MTRCQYDLIAIDLDGTLLDRSGSVSARNVAAISAARDAGIDVVIATGRALIESKHVVDAIAHRGAFIGAGGAMLHDVAADRVLERCAMDRSLVLRIAQILLDHQHLVHVLKDRERAGYDYLIVGNGSLDPATAWWFDTFPVRVRRVASLEDDEHPNETVRCGTLATAGELGPIASQIREALGDAIYLQHWAAVTETEAVGSPTHLLEVFNPDVDKSTMLRRYATTKGVDPTRIAAIGDGLNDIRMIRWAGMGVAVANAEAGVLHVANQVVASHEEHGVAQAIEAMLSGTF